MPLKELEKGDYVVTKLKQKSGRKSNEHLSYFLLSLCGPQTRSSPGQAPSATSGIFMGEVGPLFSPFGLIFLILGF